MSKTKTVYINTISALLIMSLLLFIQNLSSERALASSPSLALNDSQSNTNATTSGSTNTTNATGANLTSTLGNATMALENATAVATNATRLAEQAGANATMVLTNVSQTATRLELLLEQARADAARLSLAQQQQGFSSTIAISVGAITAMIGIPLVLNLLLRAHQGRDTSINQLYRVLVAIAVIFVVILIVAYLNSLIWFNTAQGPSNVIESLLETQKNFLTIIGTAFASLVAFYFGTRGTRDSNAERTTSITGRETAQKALKVDDMNPINGTVGVAVDSPVTATFNTSILSSTIKLNNTFSVKNDTTGEYHEGNITLTNNNTTIRFNPVPPFNRNTRYTVKITKGIMAISGASLAADVEWRFKTVE